MIIRITATAICGSDLHLYDNFMSAMKKGDVVGHEPTGEVVEIGSAVKITDTDGGDNAQQRRIADTKDEP